MSLKAPPTTPFRLHWNYWDELFDEFGLRLTHFGGRGSAEIGNNIIAYIRLATNQWWIEERSGARLENHDSRQWSRFAAHLA